MSVVRSQVLAPVMDRERRNFWVYLFDGGIWMLGMSFIDLGLVVPQMANIFLDERQSSHFVNSLPLFILVTLVGSLLTASMAERLRRQKRIVIVMAMCQRLPFLLAGLGLLVFGAEYPVESFWFAMAMLMIFFFVTGLVTNPWNELFLKTFQVDKRSGMVGKRMLLGQVLTVGIGCYLVKTLMPADVADKVAAAHGFGCLFLVAFSFALLSLWVVSKAEEPEAPERLRPRKGMFSYLKRMPAVLRNDRYFSKYLLTAFLGLAWIPVMPNFSLFATHTLAKGPDYVGFLMGVMAAGSVAGNLIAGKLGDASGGRACLLWGRGILVAVLAGFLLVPPTEVLFIVMTALLAGSIQLVVVGDFVFVTEMAPEDERPSYLSIYRLMLVPVMLAGIGIGILWADLRLATELVMLFGGMSMAACWWMTLALPEPREENTQVAPDRRKSRLSITALALKPILAWSWLRRRKAG